MVFTMSGIFQVKNQYVLWMHHYNKFQLFVVPYLFTHSPSIFPERFFIFVKCGLPTNLKSSIFLGYKVCFGFTAPTAGQSASIRD